MTIRADRSDSPRRRRARAPSGDLLAALARLAPAPVAADRVDVDTSWRFDARTMRVEREVGSNHTLSVFHPERPFECGWTGDEDALFPIADAYLARVAEALGLPDYWRTDLLGDPTPSQHRRPERLRWLPFASDDAHSVPIGSRFDSRSPTERTALLVASLVFDIAGLGETPLFGGEGLLVTAHVHRDGEAWRVSILGAMHTLPARTHGRFVAPALDAERLARFPDDVLAAFGLAPTHGIASFGLRLADDDEPRLTLEAVAHAMPTTASKAPSLELVARVDAGGRFEPVTRRTLVTFAQAPVFRRDPLSHTGPGGLRAVRPNRPSSAFDRLRTTATFSGLRATRNATDHEDLVESRNALVVVTGSEFAPPANGARAIPSVSHAPSRGDESSAANAWAHMHELFDRLARYGFAPRDYLRFIELPLVVRYRAGMTIGPGRTGKTVNAQVQWAPAPGSTVRRAPSPGERGTLEVRFALGDLSRFHSREPIGVALDPRWAWHEISHVLLAGALGDLEFPFAHSAGDALAAIVNDPQSALAGDPRWRGITFPWIPIPGRRHDREAKTGWSFAGGAYLRDRIVARPGLCDKRGYWAEQLVSSSLFRLYRALGGDALANGKPDVARRRRAAEYCVYIVIRAIGASGDRHTVMPRTPEQFVQRLIVADAASARVDVGHASPWVGGTAAKVIRWAFEQQGLGHPANEMPANAPARPLGADLYIPDAAGRAGEYTPIDLNAEGWLADARGIEAKSAAGGAIKAGAPVNVVVSVGNRGGADERRANVSLWAAPLAADGALPDWNDPAWLRIGDTTVRVASDAIERTRAIRWTPAERRGYALLAVVSSEADPAIVDSGPIARARTPLADLVPFDNNLGLRRVNVR